MQDGDHDARRELMSVLYQELRALAQAVSNSQPRAKASGATLSATVLVHELYLQLGAREGWNQSWKNRGHFLATAARAMRFLLINYARLQSTQRRGGDGQWQRISLDELATDPSAEALQVEQVSAALDELRSFNERVATIVEMRFLAGMTAEECAEELELSPRQVHRDWRIGRAFLKEQLAPPLRTPPSP